MSPQQPSTVHDERPAQPDASGIATAFDGEPTGGTTPYVRLVPPAGEATTVSESAHPDSGRPTVRQDTLFDPHDIERREYRLLARALGNEDDATDHRAAMTLVQLVKFLRAAGVSVPYFPDTGDTLDPGPSTWPAAGRTADVATDAS